jgi:hypothetical protein
VHSSTTKAEECNPRDFTIQDLERQDLSDSVRLLAYSVSDKSSSSTNSGNVSGNAVIFGVPVGISQSDAHALSDHVFSQSGLAYSKDLRSSYVRTALSSVGADMYKDCVAARNVKTEIPKIAFSDKSFFFKAVWTPQYASGDTADFEIRVINGTIDGQKSVTGSTKRFTTKTFEVVKSEGPLQITVTMDGQSPPTLVIPPPAREPKVTYKLRTGTARDAHNSPGYVCKDTAYLVSEIGSVAGNEAKSCTLCVARAEGGILLPSTAKVTGGVSSRGAAMEVQEKQNNTLEACGRFWTSGAGKDSGRFEVYEGATFSVWEAIFTGAQN